VDLKGKVAKEDSDWVKYFARIRNVCPWSYKLMDKILVIEPNISCLKTWSSLFNNSKYEAFVYKFPEATVSWLNTKCEQLNALQQSQEWLWSHPAEGGDSTPCPVLIQQDRATLENLRQHLNK